MRILGITHLLSYNQAACILDDGNLVAFAEEERFNRIKASPNKFPIQAINFCLEKANLDLDQIDAVAIGHLSIKDVYKQVCSKKSCDDWFLHSIKEQNLNLFIDLECKLLHKLNNLDICFSKLFWYDHHMCHVASSVFTSKFETCNFFSCDHSGGNTAGRLGYFNGSELVNLDYIHIQGSIGFFYESITQVLGFGPHSQEGKTMGLASYAKGKNIFEEEMLLIKNKNHVYHIDKSECIDFISKLDHVKEKALNNILCKEAIDLAACAQRCLEIAFVKNIEWLYNKTGFTRVATAGGSFLNCTANGKILGLEIVDELHVVPVSTDAGNALGAAILCHKEHLGKYPRIDFDNAYFGSEFTKNQIIESIDKYKNEHI